MSVHMFVYVSVMGVKLVWKICSNEIEWIHTFCEENVHVFHHRLLKYLQWYPLFSYWSLVYHYMDLFLNPLPLWTNLLVSSVAGRILFASCRSSHSWSKIASVFWLVSNCFGKNRPHWENWHFDDTNLLWLWSMYLFIYSAFLSLVFVLFSMWILHMSLYLSFSSLRSENVKWWF